jgi:hypothetical protein
VVEIFYLLHLDLMVLSIFRPIGSTETISVDMRPRGGMNNEGLRIRVLPFTGLRIVTEVGVQLDSF